VDAEVAKPSTCTTGKSRPLRNGQTPCHHGGMLNRSPRFRRIPSIRPFLLTERDRGIIRIVHRHRFIRSHQIAILLGGSQQAIVRRLQLLFQHGYLERPRVQLQFVEGGGSQAIAYGLGKKGAAMLRQERDMPAEVITENPRHDAVGGIFLAHTLLVSSVMVSLELACRKHGIRLLYENKLALPVEKRPFQWWVKIAGGIKLGVIPDVVFALEYTDMNGQKQRAYFFLEADRGTMPVVRKKLVQTSFYRKLLAYEATWTNKVHQRHLGIPRFRVLTVTTIPARIESLLKACSQLQRGHGLFLFTDSSALEKDLFAAVWRCGKGGAPSCLLDDLLALAA